MHPEIEYLKEVGNTLRHQSTNGTSQPIQAVLVVANTLTSHYWLNILPLSRNGAIRFYITWDDLRLVFNTLHVQPAQAFEKKPNNEKSEPKVVPAFLVFQNGYMIDWFPAPLPSPGCVTDPMQLLDAVHEWLKKYH